MIKTFDEFILEAEDASRHTFKRKYASHPAKKLNVKAKKRNLILSAIADGEVDEDELKKIIQDAGTANVNVWIKANKSFFDVAKEAGAKTKFKLNKKATDLWNKLTTQQTINTQANG